MILSDHISAPVYRDQVVGLAAACILHSTTHYLEAKVVQEAMIPWLLLVRATIRSDLVGHRGTIEEDLGFLVEGASEDLVDGHQIRLEALGTGISFETVTSGERRPVFGNMTRYDISHERVTCLRFYEVSRAKVELQSAKRYVGYPS